MRTKSISSFSIPYSVAAFAIVLQLLVSMDRTSAEVTFAGNGSVEGTTFAAAQTAGTHEIGGTADDIIVGISAPLAGGMFIDGTAPSPATLVSNSGILGQGPGSVGAVDLADLSSLWDVDLLTVGDAGQGLVDISNASAVNAGTLATIGNQATGLGFVNIEGLGSRFIADDLVVGGAGVGQILATGRGLLYTTGTTTIGAASNGDGTVILEGLGTRWAAAGSVIVGNANDAHGRIEVGNNAVFQTEAGININSTGEVALLGGTLRTVPSTTLITNDGLLLGDGFVDGAINIGNAGEIRNAAAQVINGSTVTNLRENLRISGAVTNAGTIQSLGGAMEFESLVTNAREIIARDAEMHFRSGLANNGLGTLTLGGDTTVHGTVTNNSGGSLFVLSNSESLLVGDLNFASSGVLGLSIGDTQGTLDVTGQANLAGAIVSLDYLSSTPSQAGDVFQLLQADGGVTLPTFTKAVADGQIWDLSLAGSNTLIATQSGAAANPFGADFNGDGIVNVLDLTIWQNNVPILAGAPKTLGDADGDGDVDGSDFMKIQRDFGVLPVPAFTAVPEPSTLALALLTLVCCPCRRRHRGTPLRVV